MECHLLSSSNGIPVVNGSAVPVNGKLGSQQFYHKLANGYHGAMQVYPMTHVPNGPVIDPNWFAQTGRPIADLSTSARKRSIDDSYQFQSQNRPEEFKRQRISGDFEATSAFSGFFSPAEAPSSHGDVYDAESSRMDVVASGNGANGYHNHPVGAAVTSCGHHDRYLYDAMIAEMHGC